MLSVLDLESAPAIRSVIAITDLLIFLTRACIDWRGAAVQRTRLLLQRENRAAATPFPVTPGRQRPALAWSQFIWNFKIDQAATWCDQPSTLLVCVTSRANSC